LLCAACQCLVGKALALLPLAWFHLPATLAARVFRRLSWEQGLLYLLWLCLEISPWLQRIRWLLLIIRLHRQGHPKMTFTASCLGSEQRLALELVLCT